MNSTAMNNQLQHEQQAQQQVLSRPVSAYFNNNINNSINNNTINTHSMSLQSTMPYMLPSNQIGSNSTTNLVSQNSLTMQNRQKGGAIVRDTQQQTQQSLLINQMMAPSMPNIFHSSEYPTNMSSSQSMQNVNAIHPSYHNYSPSNPPANNQSINQAYTGYHPNGYGRELHKIQESHSTLNMNETARRRNQRPQDMIPMYSLNCNVQQQTSMPNLSSGQVLLSPTSSYNDNVHMRQASAAAKSHSSQPGIDHTSPIKQMPPLGPKHQVCILLSEFIAY